MAANAYIPMAAQSGLTIRECRDWNELERLQPEWNRLLQLNPALGLFSTPEWLLPWWRAYGRNKELLSLVVTDAETRVVAILPMYLERATFFGLQIRKLRLIGDGSLDSDDLDLIIHPGYEDLVVKAFVAWARERPFDVCELNCVSPRSVSIKLLQAATAAASWTHITGQRTLVFVPLPNSWELYLKQLSSKERGKIGNRYRHLRNCYKVRFYRCETVDQLPSSLETLFALHQKRWEARGEKGSFSIAERRQFYYEMATSLLRRGDLELWFMELNGEPVAAQIGLRYGDTIYALQEGFDPSFTKESVGYVLRSHVLCYCIETGVRRYDFLAGDQDSKQRWAADTGSYTDFHFAPPGGIGPSYLVATVKARAAKGWLREHLPAGMIEKLQSLRHKPAVKNPRAP
jgi:CelD/BcsL family acetyltransferase involved in cellulose biosynthesis